MKEAPLTYQARQRQQQKPRVQARNKPNRFNRTTIAIAIIIITALSLAAYEINIIRNSPTQPAPQTLLTGTLTPTRDANNHPNNFTNVFFLQTTNRITYSAPVQNGAYSISLYSGFQYNVTIEVFTSSNGPAFCSTLPQTITVSGSTQTGIFDCYNYVIP